MIRAMLRSFKPWVSPKTVEYHRMKLMVSLNAHDIPGLVRFALRVGLIPEENLAGSRPLVEPTARNLLVAVGT
jgi:hypothetical protein